MIPISDYLSEKEKDLIKDLSYSDNTILIDDIKIKWYYYPDTEIIANIEFLKKFNIKRTDTHIYLDQNSTDTEYLYHREEYPASISFNTKGRIIELKWYMYSVAHRMYGPAGICYYDTGHISKEEYKIRGEYHREGAPALIEYYENGYLKQTTYYKNNILGNDVYPTIFSYKEDGSIAEIKYIKDGLLHRDEGPAILKYKDLICTEEKYYKNGQELKEDYLYKKEILNIL